MMRYWRAFLTFALVISTGSLTSTAQNRANVSAPAVQARQAGPKQQDRRVQTVQFESKMVSKTLARKIPHEYRQLPGTHVWPYWDAQVQEVLRLAAENAPLADGCKACEGKLYRLERGLVPPAFERHKCHV